MKCYICENIYFPLPITLCFLKLWPSSKASAISWWQNIFKINNSLLVAHSFLLVRLYITSLSLRWSFFLNDRIIHTNSSPQLLMVNVTFWGSLLFLKQVHKSSYRVPCVIEIDDWTQQPFSSFSQSKNLCFLDEHITFQSKSFLFQTSLFQVTDMWLVWCQWHEYK